MMKFSFWLCVTVLWAISAIMSSAAIIVDGTAETDYGSAIATQKLATSTFDNNLGQLGHANGSELDAAYGLVSNGVLYLTIAGNVDTDSSRSNDVFHIFFMTGAGGDHTLGTNYPAYLGRINRMGVGGNGQAPGNPGLTFDTGFAPNYWIGVNAAGPTNSLTMFADYQVVCSNCPSFFLGSSSPSNSVVDGTFGIQVALNNSNTIGVTSDPNGCTVNLSQAAVRTGAELAIPLQSGALGAATGKVDVCAFITSQLCNSNYNQFLGPITDGTPGYCLAAPCAGEPSCVNLSALPGKHFFTIQVPPCNIFLVNPTSASFGPTGGVGSVTATMVGACSWSVTSSVPWVTITSGAGLHTGSGSFTYSVSTNTTTLGRTGILTIAGQIVTQNVTVTQFGAPLGGIIIDGSVETNHYGCAPLAVQQIGTGFGDNSLSSVDFANGSELDAAYGIIENGVLYIVLAGNLESNFNKIEVFLETGPGGQNTLTNINPNVDFDGLNRMGAGGGNPGLTFDTNFAANYWISVTCGGSPFKVFANYAQLYPGGGGTNGYFLGSTMGSTNGTLFGGAANPFGIQAAVNNINSLGVIGDSCFDDPSIYQQASVRTGVELGIPLLAIGSPTGAVKVCAFVNSTSHDFLSNQVLGPIWDGTSIFCQVDLGEPRLVNFSTLPGQHYFLVGPEVHVTNITRAGNDITVNWVTGANSNLLYQLQRTTTLTTSVWSNVGSQTTGTGGIVTRTDTSAATSTTRFYRVKQTSVCP